MSCESLHLLAAMRSGCFDPDFEQVRANTGYQAKQSMEMQLMRGSKCACTHPTRELSFTLLRSVVLRVSL